MGSRPAATVLTTDERSDVDFANGIRAKAVLSDVEALKIVQEMSTITTVEQAFHRAAERSYRAYRSEHFEGSKYRTAPYRNRSKVFRPKTRATVRKSQAAAAQALFSTSDPLKVSAQDEDNPQEMASAAIKQELVNYRLSRASTYRNGIPWYLVAMGAHQDAVITGICASKQYWRFKETELEPVQASDEATGADMPGLAKQRVIEFDRPDIINIPPENIRIDAGAEWTNPAQSASRLGVMFPMSVDDAYDMITTNASNSATKWRPIEREQLAASGSYAYQSEASSIRRAREGGVDRKEESTGSVRQVWLIENFVRYRGNDYTFWSLGTSKVLSDIVPTRDAYPAFGGDRPIVIGYGSLEAHRIFPTSIVESVYQMQWELNDIVNLRLDLMKENVQPTRKVKRGANVDLEQIRNGGNSGTILVNNMEDIMWDKPPDVPQSSYEESNFLNADFDSLAGNFDAGHGADRSQPQRDGRRHEDDVRRRRHHHAVRPSRVRRDVG